MAATVERFYPRSGLVVVKTTLGNRLYVHPLTEDAVVEQWQPDGAWKNLKLGTVCAYPFRLGYASTIYKLQGAELPHITVWLDTPYKPGAGYVALSRVSYDSEYLLGGKLTPAHFTPTDYRPRIWTRRTTKARTSASEILQAPATEHVFTIKEAYADLIRTGAKTVEGRVNHGRAARVRAGDTVVLGGARARVADVRTFGSFRDMLTTCGLQAALPGVGDITEGVRIYESFPGYAAGARNCGVVAFNLEAES